MFEVGEKVKIARIIAGKNQNEVNYAYRELVANHPIDDKWDSYFVPEMARLIGTEGVIKEINHAMNMAYLVGGFNWSLMCFDKIEEEKKEMLYDVMIYDDLYEIAREKNITGRSSMNKAMLIQALKKPPIPEKKKESLGVRLNDQIRNEGTCSYAWRSGKAEFYFPADICHARLKHDKGIDEAVLNIKWHYDKHKNKELYKRFVEWMLNDSPFKKCFLTKKWKDAYEDGVYLNCDESISRIVASAIALRGGSEFPATLPVMFSLVDGGFDPSISWFISYQFVREGVKWHFNGDGGGGHKVFSASTALYENLSKFLKEGFHIEEGQDKPANEYARYYGIFECVYGGAVYKGNIMANRIEQIFNVQKAAYAFGAAGRLTDKEFYEGLSKFQEAVLK